jgi:putative spermidine/putrescine transport system substrate-binding protein
LKLKQYLSTFIGTVTLGGFMALSVVSNATAQDQTVVFAGWGGTFQKAQREILFNSFEKETGIKVIDVPDAQLNKIKLMVESGNSQWDVVNSLGMWIPQGAEQKLWESLDYKVINKDGVPEQLVETYGIGNTMHAMGISYNANAVKTAAPRSWRDFWNVASFPGRRGLFDGPRYTLEAALLADGVKPGELYPLDADRAFRSLDRIKGDISVWWKQWPQPPLLLASQELSMVLTNNSRISALKKTEKVPLEMVWPETLMTVDYLSVPRNAKNRVNAMKLIAWMTDPKRQAELAKATGIGPVNMKALNFLTKDEQDAMVLSHFNKGESIRFDNNWWAKNEPAMQERWNAWKLK